MRRLLWLFVIISLGLPVGLAAQDVPPPIETGEAPPPVETVEPIAPIETPEPTPVSVYSSDVLQVLIQVRTDLELLANQQRGLERPTGWSGSIDVNNPQLPLLLRLDLELLVGTLLAPDQRPPGWFGAIPGDALSIARDARHDLELLADTVGQAGVRPGGWVGGDPILRCERSVQALVGLLERSGAFSLTVDGNNPDFCHLAELQAAQFANTHNIPINAAAPAVSAGGTTTTSAAVAAAPPGSGRITGELALGFLNRYATEHIGRIPINTAFTPVARSFTEFSHMTLIRGDGFELFVDYQETSITEAEFAAMPDVDLVDVNTDCTAAWCQPVIHTLGSPAARRGLAGWSVWGNSGGGTNAPVSPANRIKVPVENLVILYDGQDANNSTVVRMQLCGTRGGNCQNVTEVVAPGGVKLAPVGAVNGLSQFRLPYGYSAHSLYAANYYMNDVWIAAPGQKR